jgi:cytochrome c1
MMTRTALLAATLLIATGCKNEAKQRAIALTGGGDPDRGKAVIASHGCASCHTVPGVHGANALVGPPLTSMGSRTYVAGVLQNTPDNLIKWLKDPPAVDPKTAMPNLHLSDSDARDAATYLYTLQ